LLRAAGLPPGKERGSVNVKLKFEISTSGQLEGINDAGIETFSGDHLGSLAREQGQNSMDAKAPKARGPVDVVYKLQRVKTSELPGAKELRAALTKIRDFWSEDGREDKKAQKAPYCAALRMAADDGAS
jgi:hypothetical protein